MTPRPRSRCIRCGECCLKSSPTLQLEDLALIREGRIERKNLFTIRKGELVRDNVGEALTTARREMLKIKERAGGGCIFYDDGSKACTIYTWRPIQCSALMCWDTGPFMKVYQGPKLDRRHVIKEGLLPGLIAQHESRCGYERIERHVKEIETLGEKAVEGIIDLLRFDFHLRPFVGQKLDINPEEMNFLFGRCLIDTIPMFGLKVSREPDGTFFLTLLGNPTG